MCGRYRLSRRKQMIEEYFGTVSDEDDWNPRYNIAPTQPVPVIRQNPREPIRMLSLMRWGLIPSWAKDSSIGAQTINARSETAATKPAFRGLRSRIQVTVTADDGGLLVQPELARQQMDREMTASVVVGEKTTTNRRLGVAGRNRALIAPCRVHRPNHGVITARLVLIPLGSGAMPAESPMKSLLILLGLSGHRCG